MNSAAIAAFSGVIRTARLTLRPRQQSDDETLFALFDNWKVVEWLSGPKWPQQRADMIGFLDRMAEEKRAGSAIHFVIDRAGGAIGAIDWRWREASPQQAEPGPDIGYWLGEPFWGKGYMSEAAGALCDQIFELTDAPCIFSGAFAGNDASLRVQAKLGFIEAGRSQLFSNARQVNWPHVNTVLTRAGRAAARAEAERSKAARAGVMAS